MNTEHTLKRLPPAKLLQFYDVHNRFEIGVDEAGRGPLFGRLYVAGVILPKDSSFRHEDMKDSKKFHSAKKIKMMSDYIKENALAWHIHYISEDVIDQINIRQSVLRAMHECCQQCIRKIQEKHAICDLDTDVFLLIDGNDFIPFRMYDEQTETMIELPYKTIESGDNTYTSIAAASILAKVARDEYILTLCEQYPELQDKYGIAKNKGYGTKEHLDGIREHGISEWHRKSFGICKTSILHTIS